MVRTRKKRKYRERRQPNLLRQKESWVQRQKAKREIVAAEKVVSSGNLMIKQFNLDSACVPIGEATNLSKRLEQRLALEMRWVYAGDDIDCNDETGPAEMEARVQMLNTIQGLENPTLAIAATTKCAVATEIKD